MRTVELGHTGERVSQLALGCMVMGTSTDEATAGVILDRYVDAGGTFLDTANCYAWWLRRGSLGGESEELLGRWFARTGRRDEVFLATKGGGMVWDQAGAWTADGRPAWDRVRFEGAGADTLRTAIDASLRRLGTDRVDLYYVHVDDLVTPLEETLEALAGIVQAGRRATSAGPTYAGPDADARLAVLTDVACEVGATPNQVVLAWLLRQTSPAVVPLIGPRTLGQYGAAVPALDVKLTDEQAARLDAAEAATS